MIFVLNFLRDIFQIIEAVIRLRSRRLLFVERIVILIQSRDELGLDLPLELINLRLDEAVDHLLANFSERFGRRLSCGFDK